MSLWTSTKEEAGQALLSLLYPRRCAVCGKLLREEQDLACRECRDLLSYIDPPYCMKCGRPLDQETPFCDSCLERIHLFDRTVSVWEYSDPIKHSLYGFKYKNRREYAQFYGREALRRYGWLLEMWQLQGVVPVPLHKRRLNRRGYNQAAVFGKVVAKGLSLPLCQDLLRRTKNTEPQKNLGAEQRRKNLADAFSASEKAGAFERLLLVDDIFTTGSTLDEAAAALKKAGVRHVYGLTVAGGAPALEKTVPGAL